MTHKALQRYVPLVVLDKTSIRPQKGWNDRTAHSLKHGRAHLGRISRYTLCHYFFQKTLEKISPPSYCNVSILFIFPVVKHFMFIKSFEVYIKLAIDLCENHCHRVNYKQALSFSTSKIVFSSFRL